MSMGKYMGTVLWFENARGYGFIKPADDGKDIFVHQQNILMEGFRTLSEGQIVSYSVGQNDRGPQAVDVEVVGEAEPEPEEEA